MAPPPPADTQTDPPLSTRGGRLTGEKAREKKLLDDELVIIISPQLVQCKRCAAEIKLSKKSQFDTFHWYQHRERCLKRPDAAVQEVKQKVSFPHSFPVVPER
jgi:hypothetical protein